MTPKTLSGLARKAARAIGGKSHNQGVSIMQSFRQIDLRDMAMGDEKALRLARLAFTQDCKGDKDIFRNVYGLNESAFNRFILGKAS